MSVNEKIELLQINVIFCLRKKYLYPEYLKCNRNGSTRLYNTM